MNDVPRRWSAWWIVAGAVALGGLYLPTLATRFDFIDDGNLVYPTAPMPLGERLGVVWQKIESNVRHLGPFRPVLWAHWELAADLFGGNELAWRGARLGWVTLAAGMLLWLLRELTVPLRPALLVGAIAMWAPFRNEIWTSLTLGEGVALPYALFALVAARRAARSERPLPWELGSALGVLAALGCKNTFAAIIPAQVLLRLLPDGIDWREAWRRNGWRALALTLPLVMPVAHFIYFQLNWQPGQYETRGLSLPFAGRYLHALLGGINFDFLAAGLAATLLILLLAHRAAELRGLLTRYRAALIAGALLLVCGTAMYLPIQAISGRYVLPAVWGLDLFLAVTLTALSLLPKRPAHRVAWGLVSLGVAAVALAGVGKQLKFAARAQMLWQALEVIEQEAPRGATIAWYSGDSARGALNAEEGIHFLWHLQARGRDDLRLKVIGADGQSESRVEVRDPAGPVAVEIWGPPQEALTTGWEARPIVVSYWAGRKQFECRLAQRPGGLSLRRRR